MPSRREFLTVGAVGLAALGRGTDLLADGSPATPAVGGSSAKPPLSILILGGTSFLGPHQIAYALERGHTVTTFNRGRTVPRLHAELFDHVETVVGDRAEGVDGLAPLRGRSWDAVIDNSGRSAEWTRDSASLLKDRADLYVYTSSTGVYYPYLGDAIDEGTRPVLEVPTGIDGEQSGEYGYGVMKALSEREAVAAFGEDRTIVARPTYIIGPGDTTDRFPYWPARLARGGEVLVPGKRDDPVQYIDVRDLTQWMIGLIEDRRAGTFNAVGPASRTGMLRFVHGAHAAFDSAADLVVVDDYDFLTEHRVSFSVPWIMPVGDNYGSARVDNRRAVANGLTFTPLAESVRDVHEWWVGDAVDAERRERLEHGERSLMAREADILRAWRGRG